MNGYEEKLSAFLDGELPEAEARQIEAALADDPNLQAELEALMAADALAQEEFEAIAAEPVPFELAAVIQNAPTDAPANTGSAPTGFAGWLSMAAAVALLFVGGAGGGGSRLYNWPGVWDRP